MIKLKWGEIPIGSVVFDANTTHPHAVVSAQHKSVSVLNLYTNRITKRRASTQAHVEFRLKNI